MNRRFVLSIALPAAIVLTGCATHRQLQGAERITHDTLYLSNVKYDSVYIDNWHKVYQQSDTVCMESTKYEYRYKLLRDTVCKTRIDTIPVIREVEVVREVRYIPMWAKVLSGAGAAALLLLCFATYRRVL